jgi:asparagine synthase (glutamine-hydrolysing)
VFPEQEFSEAPYMRLSAEHFCTEHTEITLTAEDLLGTLPEALAAMDQPTFDGINTYIVSKYTRQAGLTVAFSGTGGDELFAGYPSFLQAPRLTWIREWVPEVVGRVVGTAIRGTFADSDRGRKLRRWLQNCDLDGNAYLLVRELFSPSDRLSLAPRLGGEISSPHAALVEPAAQDAINRLSLLELTHYLRNVLLRDIDSMSMAHALEVRVPFLDARLVEFVLKLPGGLKVGRKQPKSLLVEAVGDLPSAVVSRRKQGFTLPFARWLRSGELRTEVEETLFQTTKTTLRREIFDERAVQDVWTRFLGGKGTWIRPWALYVLQQWCTRHL